MALRRWLVIKKKHPWGVRSVIGLIIGLVVLYIVSKLIFTDNYSILVIPSTIIGGVVGALIGHIFDPKIIVIYKEVEEESNKGKKEVKNE